MKKKSKFKAKKGISRSSGVSGVARNNVGITPLADRVLVLPTGRDEKVSASGIIIPETVDKERPDTGLVIAVGAGKRDDNGKLIPINVKVGQKVIFSKYGPDEIKISDKEYYVISEANILAVIN